MNELDKVNEFVNRRTATGSAEQAVQNAVRIAFKFSVAAIHGQYTEVAANSARTVAAIASGREITVEDLIAAARQQEGL